MSTALSAMLTESVESQAWFKERQNRAWEQFEKENYPVRTDELWRFSSVKNLSSISAPKIPAAELDPVVLRSQAAALNLDPFIKQGYSAPAGRFVFVNEQLVVTENFQQPSVLFLSFSEALEKRPDLLQEHFMAQEAKLGSKKFALLHEALVRSGTVLYVPPGVEIEAPFEVFHILGGTEASGFPHTLIIADERAKVTLIDHFISAQPDQTGFAVGVNDLIAKPGSKLTYISLQNWSRQFTSIQINSTVADREASVLNLALNFGGKYSRLESLSRMVGSGARSDMLSVTIASKGQEFDQRTLQDHLHPDTTSDLLYKNALHDDARTIFSGLIKVEPAAHRTDAYQKVRNLMLSDQAEANSMPGLEILADDVRCTHGATSGEVESDELFYLKSRGIPELAAKNLIVKGFLEEVVDRLADENLTEYLRSQIESHAG